MEFNLGDIHDAVAERVPDRPSIIWRGTTWTFAEVAERSRRFANALIDRGAAEPIDRASLGNHESGQDHVALYLHNGNEYLEAMLGAFKARAVPFNVNYRYVAEELDYLLRDSGASAIVYHSVFAPVLEDVRHGLGQLTTLIQVEDDSGHALLEGAEWYEEVLDGASPRSPSDRVTPDPDDLYMLYTGGTTGMPKGVLWRQADIWVAAMGGRKLGTADEWESIDEVLEAAGTGGAVLMPCPPFMHGAAHWMAFNAFGAGNTLVLPDIVDRFDAHDVLDALETHGVNVILIVGDAFGRPLVEALEESERDLSSLLMIVSGGAALSAGIKERMLAASPSAMVMDGLGASETGQQASQISASGQQTTSGTFTPGPGMCILSEDLDRLLSAGDAEAGWLGQSGRVPLGYLGDPDKTQRTFPVIDDVRFAVPGDRARIAADGSLELLGRDSVTINSGGEKIFAEEVEAALAGHPDVSDVVVCGRPSERWGNEVCAVVQLAAGADAGAEELSAEAERHIARYKLPKAYVFVDAIQRSPSGKADYRWAREQAVSG